MISANSIYNIIHNNAYYNQQILFDSDGNFNLELSGEQLRKYYQDYRTNPSYLTANPEDMNAREELSRDSNTECRYGYALVYRIHAGDHVCVTEQTSEMWIRHGMGKLANVNQLENMDELTIEKLRQDRITEKIKNVNNQIKSAYNAYDEKLDTIQKNYDQVYANLELEEKDEEKKALANSSSMTKKTLSQRIEDIREQYDFVAENTRKEQIKSIQIMQTNHERDMTIFVSNFESISDVKVIWNSDISGYEVVRT
jgi:transcriptional regulator of heat shock response